MEQRLQTTITFSMHFREPSEINRVPIKFRSYSQSLFSPTYHTERVVFLMTQMTLTSHLRTSNVKKPYHLIAPVNRSIYRCGKIIREHNLRNKIALKDNELGEHTNRINCSALT